MTVTYKLVGYDKRTERMAVRLDIPDSARSKAKKLAGLAISNDLEVGDWELSAPQAAAIARLIGHSIDSSSCDFFLEPYVLDGHAAESEAGTLVGQRRS